MLIRIIAIAISLFMLNGCMNDKEGQVEKATGFITSNLPPPDSAEIDEGVARDSYGRPYHYAFLGKPLPKFEATMHSGGNFNSEEIDTWTVINIWGVWCGDCRRDGPYATKLVKKLEKIDDITFIALHTPASKTRVDEAFGSYGSIKNFFEVSGYSYPTAIDHDASIRDKLSIEWTPTYLLVDPNGIVRGFRSELAVSGKKPVKRFIKDIRKVIKDS